MVIDSIDQLIHGSLNVLIEHHPTIRYMVYNGYYKVMSNIPKIGHLTTPVIYHALPRCHRAQIPHRSSRTRPVNDLA